MRLAAAFFFFGCCCTNVLPIMLLFTAAGFGSAYVSLSSKA